eukprot:3940354-Rhodomonas_salina.1
MDPCPVVPMLANLTSVPSGSPYDDPSDSDPTAEPDVTTTTWDLPTPAASRQATAESLTQSDASQLVSPTALTKL